MANVLPPDVQRRVKRATFSRFLAAFALVALGLSLVAYLALAPAYAALHLGTPAPAAAPDTSPPTPQDQATVVQAQKLVLALEPVVQATTTPAEAIARALSHRPSGISVDGITYSTANSGGPSQLVLSGAAQTPDALNAYRTALSADTAFSDVEIPVGALVGAQNGRFTITISGDF